MAATDKPEGDPLLRVEDLRVRFAGRGGAEATCAVDGVSLNIGRGESLGLVGESGSGKSTLGRAILGLVPAAGGRVVFDGIDVLAARGSEMRELRRRMQVIFQDPAGSLDPRMRIAAIVDEPLRVHGRGGTRRERERATGDLLTRCGVPAAWMDRYPHELSGGQKQRVAIARALALRPSLIVCDEPTSALDVSIQAQIVNLLADLRRDLGLSYLFISHDLAIVRHLCERVAVMRRGRIVEQGATESVIDAPGEAYTRELVASARATDPGAALDPTARDQAARVSPSIAS